MKRSRLAAFVLLSALVTTAMLASAQPKPRGRGGPAKKDAAAAAAPSAEGFDAGAALSTRAESTQAVKASASPSGDGGAVEAKTLDGGARVFRFGEVEIEGRLRSPQLVYFLRRVRAEFAAGDLGHRTFMRELSETRKEPAF